MFSLPSQKCSPFSLIRFICFLLCYSNRVIVNLTPLAMFSPRVGHEVWICWSLSLSCKCRAGKKCSFYMQNWVSLT